MSISQFDKAVAAANKIVSSTMGGALGEGNEMSYIPAGGPPIAIVGVPLDPLRLEGETPGQFTLRWIKLVDLAPYNPQRGDTVVLSGGQNYRVHQVQEDSGQGARLILTKK